MRIVQPQSVAIRDLRRRIERLDGLPIRATSARFVADLSPDEFEEHLADPLRATRRRAPTEFDPGWVLACERASAPLDVVADRGWWPSVSRPAAEALSRLWRHAVAVGLASLRLARESGVSQPEAIGRAGLLHGLGLWAVATIDPAWIVRWSAIPGVDGRREFERSSLGIETTSLGRKLAERWGLGRHFVDAAWLHADRDLSSVTSDRGPQQLRLIQDAFALAEQTPWALGPENPSWVSPSDPRLKVLIAEVQSRCGGSFVDADVAPREERLTRENARLRRTVAALAGGQASRDRFLDALAGSAPGESPEAWADRAGLALCGEPGVSAASVEWSGAGRIDGEPAASLKPSTGARPPAVETPLNSGSLTVAVLRLWTSDGSPTLPATLPTLVPAWRAWAASIEERVRLEERLDDLMSAWRERAETEEPRLRLAKLDSLAEFAAGAGHELNNPLAVIVGRAQLLLTREADPQAQRSLRAILTQAQRAHRILRDLMYVARPPEPRPRSCQPDEVWKTSLRDARPEAEERGVTLSVEGLEHGKRVWADPDALRHLADSLLRNAIEATPRGGTVRVASAGDAHSLLWTIHDNGRGITPSEGCHLFDPFFCGRQAGRGLGMGLPRASRFVELVGGEIRWHSAPGQGATFSVRLPLVEPPKPPPLETPAAIGLS